MLKTNTRYVLKNPEGVEKIISIKSEEDAAFYTPYLDKPGFVFTEVKVHQMKEECESCSA